MTALCIWCKYTSFLLLILLTTGIKPNYDASVHLQVLYSRSKLRNSADQPNFEGRLTNEAHAKRGVERIVWRQAERWCPQILKELKSENSSVASNHWSPSNFAYPVNLRVLERERFLETADSSPNNMYLAFDIVGNPAHPHTYGNWWTVRLSNDLNFHKKHRKGGIGLALQDGIVESVGRVVDHWNGSYTVYFTLPLKSASAAKSAAVTNSRTRTSHSEQESRRLSLLDWWFNTGKRHSRDDTAESGHDSIKSPAKENKKHSKFQPELVAKVQAYNAKDSYTQKYLNEPSQNAMKYSRTMDAKLSKKSNKISNNASGKSKVEYVPDLRANSSETLQLPRQVRIAFPNITHANILLPKNIPLHLVFTLDLMLDYKACRGFPDAINENFQMDKNRRFQGTLAMRAIVYVSKMVSLSSKPSLNPLKSAMIPFSRSSKQETSEEKLKIARYLCDVGRFVNNRWESPRSSLTANASPSRPASANAGDKKRKASVPVVLFIGDSTTSQLERCFYLRKQDCYNKKQCDKVQENLEACQAAAAGTASKNNADLWKAIRERQLSKKGPEVMIPFMSNSPFLSFEDVIQRAVFRIEDRASDLYDNADESFKSDVNTPFHVVMVINTGLHDMTRYTWNQQKQTFENAIIKIMNIVASSATTTAASTQQSQRRNLRWTQVASKSVKGERPIGRNVSHNSSSNLVDIHTYRRQKRAAQLLKYAGMNHTTPRNNTYTFVWRSTWSVHEYCFHANNYWFPNGHDFAGVQTEANTPSIWHLRDASVFLQWSFVLDLFMNFTERLNHRAFYFKDLSRNMFAIQDSRSVPSVFVSDEYWMSKSHMKRHGSFDMRHHDIPVVLEGVNNILEILQNLG